MIFMKHVILYHRHKNSSTTNVEQKLQNYHWKCQRYTEEIDQNYVHLYKNVYCFLYKNYIFKTLSFANVEYRLCNLKEILINSYFSAYGNLVQLHV